MRRHYDTIAHMGPGKESLAWDWERGLMPTISAFITALAFVWMLEGRQARRQGVQKPQHMARIGFLSIIITNLPSHMMADLALTSELLVDTTIWIRGMCWTEKLSIS